MENKKKNYLEKIPVKKRDLKWNAEEDGSVILEKENRGFMNRAAQKLLKKPKTSLIHLDDIGSFAWLCANGESAIIEIGEKVSERFADKAEPLYERLAEFFSILDRCGFIEWKQ